MSDSRVSSYWCHLLPCRRPLPAVRPSRPLPSEQIVTGSSGWWSARRMADSMSVSTIRGSGRDRSTSKRPMTITSWANALICALHTRGCGTSSPSSCRPSSATLSQPDESFAVVKVRVASPRLWTFTTFAHLPEGSTTTTASTERSTVNWEVGPHTDGSAWPLSGLELRRWLLAQR